MQRTCWAFLLVFQLWNASYAQVGAIDPHRAAAPIPEVRHPTLPDFSMDQRAAIYKTVVQNSASTTVPFDLDVTVGTVLPETIAIAPIPEPVATEIPGAKNYSSAVWRDEVLLVNPKTRAVADILRGYILRDQKSQ